MAWKLGEMYIFPEQQVETRQNMSMGSPSWQRLSMGSREVVTTPLQQRYKFYQLNCSVGSMDCTDELSIQ